MTSPTIAIIYRIWPDTGLALHHPYLYNKHTITMKKKNKKSEASLLDDLLDNTILFGHSPDERNGNVYICKKMLLLSLNPFDNRIVFNDFLVSIDQIRYGKESDDLTIDRLTTLSKQKAFNYKIRPNDKVLITITNRDLIEYSVEDFIRGFISSPLNLHHRIYSRKPHANIFSTHMQKTILLSLISRLYKKHANATLTVCTKDIKEDIDKLLILLACESMGLYVITCIDKDEDCINEFVANIGLSDSLLEQLDLEIDSSSTEKQKISGMVYNNAKATITLRSRVCNLKIDSLQHRIYKALFKKPIGKLICWDEIWEQISNSSYTDDDFDKDLKKHRRSLYDAVRGLNNKAKDALNTKEDLLTWTNNSIKRNY